MDTTEFGKGIYFIAASLGWLPLVGMTLVAVAGMLRNKTQGIWVLAHRLSLVVVLLALVHAQMIGSEVKGGIWFSRGRLGGPPPPWIPPPPSTRCRGAHRCSIWGRLVDFRLISVNAIYFVLGVAFEKYRRV